MSSLESGRLSPRLGSSTNLSQYGGSESGVNGLGISGSSSSKSAAELEAEESLMGRGRNVATSQTGQEQLGNPGQSPLVDRFARLKLQS